jgi:hypothetical protein
MELHDYNLGVLYYRVRAGNLFSRTVLSLRISLIIIKYKTREQKNANKILYTSY